MNIKKVHGTIVAIADLTPTAKEVIVELSEDIPFVAGSFVNVFFNVGGVSMRRAFSISSADTEHRRISLAIRLNPAGGVSPLLWKEDFIGREVSVMGPLGLNTADKMQSPNVFLFGFGIGAGVVKSLTEHFVARDGLASITIMTGSRTCSDLVYKEYFDALAAAHENVTITYIVSRPEDGCTYSKGYIQDHIDGFSFDDADVYVCGQEAACNTLVERIKTKNPSNASFFIEGFH